MADGVQSSRPTVLVAGTESTTLTGGILRARVREDVAGLFNCEAEFGNWGPKGDTSDFLYFDRKLLDFGKELRLKVADKTLFSGRITAIEGRFAEGNAPSIVVLAEDRLQDLRMTRRTRTFSDVTDADIFSQIASDHGLTADVGVTGPTHKVVAQLNQSDLAFMRERARSIDAEVAVEDRTLTVKPRPRRATAPVKLTYGKELRAFRVLADLAGQCTSVEVCGWDVAGKAALKESADKDALGGEVNGGDSGARVLQDAFGARKDALTSAVPHTGEEARARAEAVFKRRARRFVVGHGVAETRPELRVGATLQLEGLGPLFKGEFYLAGVTHVFDGAGGLRSELEVERPGLGRPQ